VIGWQTVIWVLYALLLILLVAPALVFLIHGWASRRDDILDSLSPEAALAYLKCFHASEDIASLTGKQALEWISRFYRTQFGRGLFVAPLLICLGFGGGLLYVCAITAVEWLMHGALTGGILPAQAVLAVLGSYMWVSNDQIIRASRSNISPGDLYWSSFRFAIAVPMAYAFSAAFKDALALPMAFLLGSFPTSTIMTVSRRVAAKYVQLTDAPQAAESQLQLLPGVDTNVAERLTAEDVTTIQQLAYLDPVKLTIRTGLGFNYVLGIVGDALFWSYLGEKIAEARKYGVNGATDCRDLYLDLGKEDREPSGPQKYHDLVADLAAKLQLPTEGLRNLIDQVALDPFTVFQWQCWGTDRWKDFE
jgi:hypothetical protein